MPKKFQGENTKAVSARIRKAELKATEKEKNEREKEDQFWKDDDKQIQRKMQRKNEQAQKRQQQLEKKLENQKIHDEEMVRLDSNVKTSKQQVPKKVTQVQIEQQKQFEDIQRKEEEKRRILEQKKIVVLDGKQEAELPENLNRLQIEGETAETVDEAIELLKEGGSIGTTQDRRPEKRLKAAFSAFEDRRIPILKEEHPTFRLSQLKQLVKKEWQKSPDNPLNQKIMNIIK